ncbi:MAG TPA: AraC family transcriptional regulator [Actinomycetota bacterium]|nr:AraC family transcriptional regulator [Actinomycetota bacterium]
MQALVRCATLSGYIDLARVLGLETDRLLHDVGLNAADLAVPEKWIPAGAVARLLAASAVESGHDDFALKLAERRRLSTLGPLSVVLREEPDLREALALLIRYEHSYNESLRMTLTETDSLATVWLWFEFGEPAPTEQALALGLAALHGIIRACVDPDWRPLSVCLTQHPPVHRETYRQLFGPGLRFDHEFTGLVMYAADLDRPNRLADPLMRPYAQQFLDSVVAPRAATWTDRTRDLIELLLPLGKCSLDQAAKALGVDPRTLQRMLAGEGGSFSTLLHSVRAGLAERHLAGRRYSLTEVSEVLGFAAPSAFSRWFSQQFGVSPSAWRANTSAPQREASA